MKKPLFFFLFLIVLASSCNNGSTASFQPMRLLQYNIPFTILAPDSVAVEKEDLIFQQGITFRNDAEGYFVQLWIRKNQNNDQGAVKAELLEEVKAEPYFSRIIQEDEDGFIFEKQIDSSYTNYDFRHLKIQGDKEYIFQTGYIGTFTQEEVQNMYNGVRNK